MTHARRRALSDTQSLEQGYSITIVTCVMVKGSLMPLVLGNCGAFGVTLAKTTIILSVVAPQSIILVVPALRVDSVVVFSSFHVQFRATRGQSCPRHEYMNK